MAQKRLARTTVTRTLRHRDVTRLTKRIVTLERQAGKSDVEARVEIGDLLEQVRERLPHGEWLRWLESDVPFTERSARTYIHLYEWAKTHVVLMQRFAPLGPSKLYVLSRLPGPQLAALVKRKRHRIPDTGKVRTLEGMTFMELVAVARATAGQGAGATANRALIAYRRRVSALLRATEELAAHRSRLPRPDVVELHAALLEAAAQLTASFALPK